MTIQELRHLAAKIRHRDLQAIFAAGAGHIGSEMSVIDMLTALYFKVLNIDPVDPKAQHRDRFILSKGHAACALYVVLAERGFIDKEEIATFLQPLSRLNGHPDCNKVPGVETNTGPLGHGLPVAVGTAIAARLSQRAYQTYVITGDGEMQEGSNWEAIMCAAQYRLDNLTLLIDHNRLQQGGRVEDTNNLAPIAAKVESFGWQVIEINGNDMGEICEALDASNKEPGKPRCIVAHTDKGHGISFMQDRVQWHHKVPDEKQYQQALTELAQQICETA